MAVGAAALAWTVLTWQWRDPVTSVYTAWEQRRLVERLEDLARHPQLVTRSAEDASGIATRLRLMLGTGEPVARLRIPRLGLNVVVVKGTDEETLRKGPGLDPRGFMPGEGKLVYLAGHRTTYLAPFAEIDRLRPGDRIVLEAPYGRFEYSVTGHRIVDDHDLSVLRSPAREVVRLQACHPRFFATKRYVVSAEPIDAERGQAARASRRTPVKAKPSDATASGTSR
jgi:sortase A